MQDVFAVSRLKGVLKLWLEDVKTIAISTNTTLMAQNVFFQTAASQRKRFQILMQN